MASFRTTILCLTALFILTACRPVSAVPVEIASGSATPALPLSPASIVDPTEPPEEGLPAATVPVKRAVPGEDSTGLPLGGRTNQQPDGNRIVAGQGDLPSLAPLDIPLARRPAWITALPYAQGAIWGVALEDGQTQAFWVEGGVAQEIEISPERLPAGMPPLLHLDGQGRPYFVLPPAEISRASHPIFINEDGDLAYIDTAGRLIIQQGSEQIPLPLKALPDARLLIDERRRLLLLTDPTSEYDHGVLGDELEAGSVSLVETQPTPRLIRSILMEPSFVIEGIAPLWVDLDGDGQREIIVTRSSYETGAQVVVYADDGRLLAAGPEIGRAFRWRHQLAVAPFSPDGHPELVDVLTPHIGGIVEFYQWQADHLSVVASISGHTSHVIGAANLDMALAGRLDQSGRYTLLLPTQDRTQLSGIQHREEGAVVAWQLPLEGQLVTNLAAVITASGQIAVAAGRFDGSLRLWQL